jgi:hypothetical protein
MPIYILRARDYPHGVLPLPLHSYPVKDLPLKKQKYGSREANSKKVTGNMSMRIFTLLSFFGVLW